MTRHAIKGQRETDAAKTRWLGIMACRSIRTRSDICPNDSSSQASESLANDSGTDGTEPPFGESRFYRRLSERAAKHGMRAYVFAPEDIRWDDAAVRGYAFDAGADVWRAGCFPLPDVVYDRRFYSGGRDAAAHRPNVRRLAASGAAFLARSLRGKWDVQRSLARDPALARHLPPTGVVRGADTILRWLERCGAVFLKPNAGTHGRGAVRLAPLAVACGGSLSGGAGGAAQPGAYEARGRTAGGEPFVRRFAGAAAVARWAAAFAGRRRYLIQPYLRLDHGDGSACDIRALVQKDGRARWRLTGMAVRRGLPGSVTANLHGGGVAEAVPPFLAARFAPAHAARIDAQLRALARAIPPALEATHGRLMELGIDLGVDRSGRVWIIEVNSKPGRASFDALPDADARELCVDFPAQYARYVASTRQHSAPPRIPAEPWQGVHPRAADKKH